ncbi:MAG: hypothetical protein C9356_12160 [Oleiphilus sp.]|nr:MAG: hypothetical protein C9356_12160 [Oleiphilus sp.]
MSKHTAIEQQASKVRTLYARHQRCTAEYEREFAILHQMRLDQMAAEFRSSRGLSDHAKTPYD